MPEESVLPSATDNILETSLPSKDVFSGGNETVLPQGTGTLLKDNLSNQDVSAVIEITAETLAGRIRTATLHGGLQLTLPDDFPDWKVSKSENPFEALFIDYELLDLITPELARNNYEKLTEFWKKKLSLMQTGANREIFKRKYEAENLNIYIQNIENAYQKLKTKDSIIHYFNEINEKRLKKGKDALGIIINLVFKDGRLEPTETESIFEQGVMAGLKDDEISNLIQEKIDQNELVAHGRIKGKTQKERLLSVSWMTKTILKEVQEIEKLRKSATTVKFLGKSIESIPELGTLLFEDEENAKSKIRQATFFDVVEKVSGNDMDLKGDIEDLARILKGKPDAFFWKVVYKFNPSLPYRFNAAEQASTLEQYSEKATKDEEHVNLAKEQLNKGMLTAWLEFAFPTEFNILEQTINEISATNFPPHVDLGRLVIKSFCYKINKFLPYRLGDVFPVNTITELAAKIDESQTTWELGIEDMLGHSIAIWLRARGYESIANKFNDTGKGKASHLALEHLLYYLDPNITKPEIEIIPSSINFDRIENGKSSEKEIEIRLKGRGVILSDLIFKTNPDNNLHLSPKNLFLCANEGEKSKIFKIKVAPGYETKAGSYKGEVILKDRQDINLPILFRIGFPLGAFIWEVSKPLMIFGALGFTIRFLLGVLGYKTWLTQNYNFVNPSEVNAIQNQFIWFCFALVIAGSVWGLIKLRKEY